MKRSVWLLLFAAAVCTAQPFIFGRGIVNGANSLPFGIRAGGIARGSIFTIYGRNLGPATPAQASSFPLGITLGNVAVTVSGGATTVNAVPLYVSETQINAIMPSNTPLGTVAVRVLFNNSPSNYVPVRVAANSPGIISVRGTGMGPGVIQNFNAPDQQPLNSLQTPAMPGQVVTMWSTGLGAVPNDTVAPAAGDLPVNVEIFAGGKEAAKLYAGRAPCCAGTDQIVFQLPDDVPRGCWVPVYLRVAGSVVSNAVTMAITDDGSPCAPETQAGAALVRGGKLGVLAPMRSDIRQPDPARTLDLRSDFLVARFGEERGGQFAFNPLFSLPPPGTCTAYAGAGDWFSSDGPLDEQPGIRTLAAGTILVSANGRQTTFTTPWSPLTLGYLGSINPWNPGRDTTMLGPGQGSIIVGAGRDVAGFNAAFTMPSAPAWTNRDSLAVVDRSTGFTVNFTGGQAVAVVGGSVDLPTNSSAAFACLASPGVSSVTVPPTVLANLPVGRGTRESKAIVFLVSAASANSFTATGLDGGVIAPVMLSGKAVTVK